MRDSQQEPEPPQFEPVPVRPRHDGWTPDKQRRFIEVLAESALVDEACRHVGMSRESAYRLRRRLDAIEFRAAWDAAMDHAMSRVSDAAIGRAIYGVPVPHYYKGELIGEHRRYDERLTMWLMRYRDPARYGKWRDGQTVEQTVHHAASRLAFAIQRLVEAAIGLVTRPLRERMLGAEAVLDQAEDEDGDG
jgi:hypothetical protein